jgi:DNA-binding protein inhibitor ID
LSFVRRIPSLRTATASVCATRIQSLFLLAMKPQPNRVNSKLEESLRATLRTASSITRRRLLGNLEEGCSQNMNVYYERLRNMVPFIPLERKLSKVEILQHVIDYIQDLQNALEANSALRTPTSSTNRANRRPLTSISLNKSHEKVRQLCNKVMHPTRSRGNIS